jgi:hypothetical protein
LPKPDDDDKQKIPYSIDHLNADFHQPQTTKRSLERTEAFREFEILDHKNGEVMIKKPTTLNNKSGDIPLATELE